MRNWEKHNERGRRVRVRVPLLPIVLRETQGKCARDKSGPPSTVQVTLVCALRS